MKKIIPILLIFALLFSSCTSSSDTRNANSCAKMLQDSEDLLLQCVAEMEKFGDDRMYVAMESEEVEDGEEPKPPRLVSYPKESEDRTEIENETLERALTQLGFRLIFFQTANNSRRCVIFSYAKESDSGIQNGIYYTYDTLPCAWWGRNAELVKKHGRWLQIDKSGNAAYYTLPLSEYFYYFEKYGNLRA